MALLTGGMSLPAQMAAAGIAGAAGAGLAGKDPAKAGLISAATAGLMGGTGANDAIGRAVGDVGGALAAKTTEEVAKTAAEKAAEQARIDERISGEIQNELGKLEDARQRELSQQLATQSPDENAARLADLMERQQGRTELLANAKALAEAAAELAKIKGASVRRSAHTGEPIPTGSTPPPKQAQPDKADTGLVGAESPAELDLEGISAPLAALMRKAGIDRKALAGYSRKHLRDEIDPASFPSGYVADICKTENWTKVVATLKGAQK
jgi:hypothetical protein